jgi:hypothetical protein
MIHQRPLFKRPFLLLDIELTRGISFRTLATAFCLLLLPITYHSALITAVAQSATATLSGSVEDTNGAIIPGAQVTIENVATRMRRQAKTNDGGLFTVPLLPPGEYTLTVECQGFAPVRVEKVVLNVGDQKALQIQLRAGDVNAQVTIDSDAETVRTDGSVGTVVDRQFVANIPLNGRSLHALIQLTPGVVLTASPNVSSTSGASFSVNGQRNTANYWMVDGVSANTGMAVSESGYVGATGSGTGQSAGLTALGGTNSLVSLDALQEFRIDTSTFAPEFGRTPGGQISLLTRSGTNVFHGVASYYFRHDALDANDWFANAGRQPKPKERQHFFGGALGGPLKSNRIFFFGSYEGLRLDQPQVQLRTLPTAALRAQAVPSLRPYLNALPLPNGRDFGNGTAQLTASYSDPGRFNIFSLRIDGRITNSLTTFIRFNHAPSETKIRANALSTVQHVQVRDDAITGGLTWIANSHLTADLRLNWTRNWPRLNDELDAFSGAIVPVASDVFAPGRDPSNSAFLLFGLPGGTQFYWGTGTADKQRQVNAVGAVVWTRGSHQVKFGVDYRRLFPSIGGPALEAMVMQIPQQVLSGRILLYDIYSSDPVRREPVFSNLSLYGQDAWRVSRRLTVTYGLRFERVPSPTESNGRLPRTVLGIENDPPTSPRLAPQGAPLFHSRFGELAPRVGIAYQVNSNARWGTTLRGGFGVFHDLPFGNIATAFGGYFPFSDLKVVCCNVALPLSSAARVPPVLGSVAPTQLWLLDPNLRLPYTLQWNGTWEQSLGSAQSLTLSYVGASGRRLLVLKNYGMNLADFPRDFTTFYIQRNAGASDYNAMQAQYRHRLSRGLQALVSYSLAHSRDNATTAEGIEPPGSIGNQDGPSDFDVRHQVSGALSYDLPAPAGSGILKSLSHHWGLDLLLRAQSAFPITPIAAFVSDANGTGYYPRPNLVPGQALYIHDGNLPGGRKFNASAFTAPTRGQQGNFPRNGLRGFPISQLDLALRREFKLHETWSVQLRAEVFNVFNHPNFGSPVSDITNQLFGQPTQMLNRSLGGLNALYQMGGPRSGELSIKINF